MHYAKTSVSKNNMCRILEELYPWFARQFVLTFFRITKIPMKKDTFVQSVLVRFYRPNSRHIVTSNFKRNDYQTYLIDKIKILI